MKKPVLTVALALVLGGLGMTSIAQAASDCCDADKAACCDTQQACCAQ